ncbi:hypothetical protein [Dysgonomonas sp. 521]|uniref:hypothetical protein n=1 Tax=Dysgonomonas sp. 521 TaxID=2302932 RepID=UPI001628A593|nr:hypothetical protein [Dysgonomonas sp. 521]
MKQLFFCFSFIIVLMACSTKPTIEGRWAMEMDHNRDTVVIIGGDTIVAPELRIDRDSMYMEVRTNGLIAKSECLGFYTISSNLITVTDRMGKQQTSKFEIKDDILTVTDKDHPDKIIMRLVRIKEKE